MALWILFSFFYFLFIFKWLQYLQVWSYRLYSVFLQIYFIWMILNKMQSRVAIKSNLKNHEPFYFNLFSFTLKYLYQIIIFCFVLNNKKKELTKYWKFFSNESKKNKINNMIYIYNNVLFFDIVLWSNKNKEKSSCNL